MQAIDQAKSTESMTSMQRFVKPSFPAASSWRASSVAYFSNRIAAYSCLVTVNAPSHAAKASGMGA